MCRYPADVMLTQSKIAGGTSRAALKFKLTCAAFMRAGDQKGSITSLNTNTLGCWRARSTAQGLEETHLWVGLREDDEGASLGLCIWKWRRSFTAFFFLFPSSRSISLFWVQELRLTIEMVRHEQKKRERGNMSCTNVHFNSEKDTEWK